MPPPWQIIAKHASLLRICPRQGTCLGAALFRAGRFEAAASELEKAIQSAAMKDGWDYFFLAMAQYHVGHLAEAQRRLDQAIKLSAEAALANPGEHPFSRPYAWAMR